MTPSNNVWPEALFDLVFIPNLEERLDELAGLAEPEEWDYQNTPTEHRKPILYNYLRYTYSRLAEEGKVAVSEDVLTGCVSRGDKRKPTPTTGSTLAPLRIR